MLFRSLTTNALDDAGIQIQKRVLAPPINHGHYSLKFALNLPSLSAICLLILAKYSDELCLPVRLHYRPEITPSTSFQRLDPRLWAVLVQIYDDLPVCLGSYNIPLSDLHLPLLQRLSCTSQFSIITILDLPACPDLTDDTIYALKLLHSLVAFDASATTISSYAIKVLSHTLVATEYDATPRGPWSLRILRLRNCKNIDNVVYSHISPFPLLSVVGASLSF
jgi:hypothetical protein